MNKTFELEFGYCQPILPLSSSGNIICGNATLLDWDQVCVKEDDKVVYILGNPPYLGFNAQKPHHTDEIRKVFSHLSSHKYFDYISCWFYKAAIYIRFNDSFAFVATNSICQGMQVSILWPHLFKLGLEIGFAHQSFTWTNNAKNNAGVICCIVGLRHIKNNKKLLINEQVTNEVSNINAYLVEGKSTIVEKKQKPISKLTQMATGNIPYDGGHLILSNEEKINILNKHPDASRLIRPFIGSSEYIRGETRWCLWISNDDLQLANSIPEISERILKVAESRKMGGKIAKNYENVPHRFYMINTAINSQILVPRVSSIRRDYIPIGYVTPEAIIADSAQAIYDPEPEVFSLITSKMHMIWVRTLAGRLKNDYRYSAILCYNTFPVPELSKYQRNKLIELGFNIITVREEFSHLTLAELYDPIKMPDKLRAAHIENDNYVESCYKKSGFSNDEQRLEYLINLYVEMTG